MKIFKVACVLSILGTVLAFASAILFIIGLDIAGAVGVFSTIISIILGFVSIAYTYISGLETMKTISDIKEQNDCLVAQIRKELRIDNYNESNLENLLK